MRWPCSGEAAGTKELQHTCNLATAAYTQAGWQAAASPEGSLQRGLQVSEVHSGISGLGPITLGGCSVKWWWIRALKPLSAARLQAASSGFKACAAAC